MKKELIFRKLCAEIKRIISDCDLPFFCYPVSENFMWIGTNDRNIGGMLCHYEILLTNKTYNNYDDKNPITVDVHFETELLNSNTNIVNQINQTLKGLSLYYSPDKENKYYYWYHHDDKKFPLDTSYNNIESIVQELIDINDKYNAKITKIFHP